MANQILRNAPFFYPTKSFNFFLNLTVFQVRKEGEGGEARTRPFISTSNFIRIWLKYEREKGPPLPPSYAKYAPASA
jgi:hypothetical protein